MCLPSAKSIRLHVSITVPSSLTSSIVPVSRPHVNASLSKYISYNVPYIVRPAIESNSFCASSFSGYWAISSFPLFIIFIILLILFYDAKISKIPIRVKFFPQKFSEFFLGNYLETFQTFWSGSNGGIDPNRILYSPSQLISTLMRIVSEVRLGALGWIDPAGIQARRTIYPVDAFQRSLNPDPNKEDPDSCHHGSHWDPTS